jgi:hypothetical protein
MAAVVAVSIHAAADVSPELSAAAVRSCQAALGEGQCRLDEADGSAAEWQATVTSEDERLDAARIELRRSAGTPVLVTRDLSFVPDDAPRERWASVGVLIAALVVARSREAEAAVSTVKGTPSREPSVPQLRVPPAGQGTLRLDLHALLARRSAQGSPEFGAQFRASVLPGLGPWFGIASIAAARRAGTDPTVSWVSVTVGPGFRIGSPAQVLAAEFSGGGVVEGWVIGASEPGRSEHSGKYRAGGFVGAEGLWAVHSRWILSLGVEGRVVIPRLQIDISGHPVERVSELGWLLFAGLRFIP